MKQTLMFHNTSFYYVRILKFKNVLRMFNRSLIEAKQKLNTAILL